MYQFKGQTLAHLHIAICITSVLVTSIPVIVAFIPLLIYFIPLF
jgi:hypothetical protein